MEDLARVNAFQPLFSKKGIPPPLANLDVIMTSISPMQMTDQPPGNSELTFFSRDSSNGKGGLSAFNNEELSKLSDFLISSSSTKLLAPDQRSISTNISTQCPSSWERKNFEYNFEVTRKVEGLPSVWINKMQHSGTHFINSRLNSLGYAKCDIQNEDNPWINKNMLGKFIQGGYSALTELHPNPYNVHLFKKIILETPVKVVLHFRDPRSIMVSSIHLMYKKVTDPDQVYENSLKYPDAIIPVDFPSRPFEERLEFYISKYYPKWASFVNEWFSLISKLKLQPESRSKILLRDFNMHLTGRSGQYLQELINFLDVKDTKVTVPSDFCDPSATNSHFRKGLTEEWRDVCTEEQIDWMTKQIHPSTLEFFNWAKN